MTIVNKAAIIHREQLYVNCCNIKTTIAMTFLNVIFRGAPPKHVMFYIYMLSVLNIELLHPVLLNTEPLMLRTKCGYAII